MPTGDVPDPTEVYTVMKLSETRVAFKSGYGKYLSVDMERRLVGRSEAISNREQFEPVFQEVRDTRVNSTDNENWWRSLDIALAASGTTADS